MNLRRIIQNTADPLAKIRNFGLIAHIDAGKTTTTERILYFTGRTHKIGEVHNGEAIMDRLEDEKKRGITIQSAATYAQWGGANLNIIDTPGHLDFGSEVERSLRVLDGAITVFCSVGGVEPQSETVWRQATRYGVPRLCFVNKMDRIGANFDAAIKAMRNRLGTNAVPIQLPIGEEHDFRGIVDLVEQRAYIYVDKPQVLVGAKCEIQEVAIPSEMEDEVAAASSDLIEALCDVDDDLALLYLDGENISTEQLQAAIRKATLSLRLFPVLCGSSLKDKGVQALLNAVVDYLPSPVDAGLVKGIHPKTQEEETRTISINENFSALAFKSTVDHIGTLTYLRIYSGKLSQGDSILNATQGDVERVGRLYMMHSDQREPIDVAEAGNIVTIVGAKNVRTGDTLCAKDAPIVFSQMNFAEPVISLAIAPDNNRANDRLAATLAKLALEDPTFHRKTEEKTGEIIVSGMGELHLEIILTRITRDYKIPLVVGPPTVQYKQTLEGRADVEGRHKKQSGGHGQFGRVNVRFRHSDEGKPLAFLNEVKGGAVDKVYITPVEKGIKDAMAEGGSAKIEFTGIEATLYDGEMHEVDSSDFAFRAAGRLAFEEAHRAMKRVLLEPLMKFEVSLPDEYVGDVTGDLSRRRALIEGMDGLGLSRIIRGTVPMSEMFGYQTALMSITSGRGSFSLEPHTYAKVPDSIAEKVYEELIREKK